MSRVLITACLSLLFVLGCGRSETGSPQLSVEESRAVKSYLDAVAAMNRDSRDQRLQLRWFVPGVPGVIWEGRGSPRLLLGDVTNMQAEFTLIEQRARAIDPVPPAAASAHQALVESLTATQAMLAVHRKILAEAARAQEQNADEPDRQSHEAELRVARERASAATEAAERQLTELVQRYEASKGQG